MCTCMRFGVYFISLSQFLHYFHAAISTHLSEKTSGYIWSLNTSFTVYTKEGGKGRAEKDFAHMLFNDKVL